MTRNAIDVYTHLDSNPRPPARLSSAYTIFAYLAKSLCSEN